jgi:outer membrane protein OmpA-like peptidoglycan-associated protein
MQVAAITREGALDQFSQERKMKKILLVSTLAVCLSIGSQSALAEELGEAVDYDQQWQGMGLGAVVGAIVGGPPGFVIGVAGGGLIGRTQGLEADLESTQQQLESLKQREKEKEAALQKSQQKLTVLQQKLIEEESAQAKQTEALRMAGQKHAEQLDAISKGLIFSIHFKSESAELEPHFQRQLDQVVSILKSFPELYIHIESFADRRGAELFNEILTRQRATVVERYLRTLGVSVRRIHQYARGESRAVYPITDAEGMAFDRRVLIYFARR